MNPKKVAAKIFLSKPRYIHKYLDDNKRILSTEADVKAVQIKTNGGVKATGRATAKCCPAAAAGAVGAVSSSRAEAVTSTGAAISAGMTAGSTEVVAAVR